MLILSDHSIKQKALHQDLPLIDYGARMYDPTVARWMSPDPLAENYYSTVYTRK